MIVFLDGPTHANKMVAWDKYLPPCWHIDELQNEECPM